MGNRKRFNRIITKWIKSDLPDDVTVSGDGNVLLLGVTRLPTSPPPTRRTVHATPAPSSHDAQNDRNFGPGCRLTLPFIGRGGQQGSYTVNPVNHGQCDSDGNGNSCVSAQPDTDDVLTDDVIRRTKARAVNGASNGYKYSADRYSVPDPKTSVIRHHSGFGNSSVAECHRYSSVECSRVSTNGNVVNGRSVLTVDGADTDNSRLRLTLRHQEHPTNRAITMDRSMDSIGSCSLDVEVSNADLSRTDSDKTSVGTLRSYPVNTDPQLSPIQQPSTANEDRCSATPELLPQQPPPPRITHTSATGSRLPSYLSLACTVNGYSTTTNYDPERLALARSRDHSPHRLPPLHHHSHHAATTGDGIQALTNLLSPPNLVPLPPLQRVTSRAPEMSSIDTMYTTQSAFRTKDGAGFVQSMFAKEVAKTNGVDYKAKLFEPSNNHSHHHHVSSHNHSNQQHQQDAGKADVVDGCFNGIKHHIGAPLIEDFNSAQTKSFIQQRVERLYGPGALAQGFFISKQSRRSTTTISASSNSSGDTYQKRNRMHNASFNGTTNTNDSGATNNLSAQDAADSKLHSRSFSERDSSECAMRNSVSSPALPVLRHLRPEFRAQLPPVTSPRRTITHKVLVEVEGETNGHCISNDHAITPTSQLSGMIPKSVTVPVLTLDTVSLVNKKADDRTGEGNDVLVIVDDVVTVANGHAGAKIVAQAPKSSIVKPSVNGHGGASAQNGDVVVNGATLQTFQLNGSGATAAAAPAKIVAEKSDSSSAATTEESAKDGHYFITLLEREAHRLLTKAAQAEQLLDMANDDGTDLTEDARGYIRSVSGKARLLVSQKMQQFRGLCTNNITQVDGEVFPTTNEDLQGFWDMVMLQVDQVDSLFANLEKLKKNKWKEDIIEPRITSSAINGACTSAVAKRSSTSSVRALSAAKAPSKAELERRQQREALRKQMLEQRRKQMREKKHQLEESVEFFVPETS